MTDNTQPPADTPEQPKGSPADAPSAGDGERPNLPPPTDTPDQPDGDQPQADTNSDIGDRPNLDQPDAVTPQGTGGQTETDQGAPRGEVIEPDAVEINATPEGVSYDYGWAEGEGAEDRREDGPPESDPDRPPDDVGSQTESDVGQLPSNPEPTVEPLPSNPEPTVKPLPSNPEPVAEPRSEGGPSGDRPAAQQEPPEARPNEGIRLQHPDGAVQQRDTDGTNTFTSPDGSTMSVNPDGPVVASPGVTLKTAPDGDLQGTTSDGYTVTASPGGDMWVESPDGNTRGIGRDGTISVSDGGGWSMVTSSDGSKSTTTTQSPDGTILARDSDGITSVGHADGSQTTFHPDGTVAHTAPDGTTTVTEPGGTISVTTSDGVTRVSNPAWEAARREAQRASLAEALSSRQLFSDLLDNSPAGPLKALEQAIAGRNAITGQELSTVEAVVGLAGSVADLGPPRGASRGVGADPTVRQSRMPGGGIDTPSASGGAGRPGGSDGPTGGSGGHGRAAPWTPEETARLSQHHQGFTGGEGTAGRTQGQTFTVRIGAPGRPSVWGDRLFDNYPAAKEYADATRAQIQREGMGAAMSSRGIPQRWEGKQSGPQAGGAQGKTAWTGGDTGTLANLQRGKGGESRPETVQVIAVPDGTAYWKGGIAPQPEAGTVHTTVSSGARAGEIIKAGEAAVTVPGGGDQVLLDPAVSKRLRIVDPDPQQQVTTPTVGNPNHEVHGEIDTKR